MGRLASTTSDVNETRFPPSCVSRDLRKWDEVHGAHETYVPTSVADVESEMIDCLQQVGVGETIETRGLSQGA